MPSILLLIAWLVTPISAQPSTTFTLEKGELPILLVAPHGGSGSLSEAPIRRARETADPHFSSKKDMMTAELARSYSEQLLKLTGKKPSLLVSEVHRKYCDLNRQEDWSSPAPAGQAFHREYHTALKLELDRLLSEHGWVLLLDIHGQSSEPHDLMIGIREGQVIGDWSRRALWGEGGVIEALRGEGFTVVPDRPEQEIRFGGGFIVKTYGADERVEAWQLEHGGNLRFDPERSRKFVKLMVGALAAALANAAIDG